MTHDTQAPGLVAKRLRRHAHFTATGSAHDAIMEAADLIEQQAARIAEVEAERDAAIKQREHWHEGWKRAMHEFDLKCKEANKAHAERDAATARAERAEADYRRVYTEACELRHQRRTDDDDGGYNGD